MENLGIKQIEQKDQRTLRILWTDDAESLLDTVELRRNCPCAVCVDEWSHERKLKPGDVPDTVRPVRIDSVGRYALTVQFNDNHKTGIYTYKLLRDLAGKNTKH